MGEPQATAARSNSQPYPPGDRPGLLVDYSVPPLDLEVESLHDAVLKIVRFRRGHQGTQSSLSAVLRNVVGFRQSPVSGQQLLQRGARQATSLLLDLIVAFVIGSPDSLWALLASQLRRWFNASPSRGRALGTVGGMSMIGLGVAVG